MRLATFSAGGAPRVGARTDGGQIVDLNAAYYAAGKAKGQPVTEAQANAAVPPEMVAFLSAGEGALEAARDVLKFVAEAGSSVTGPWGSRVVFEEGEVRLLSPLLRPSKIIGIGLNYRDHAEEQGARIPKAPMIFAKFPTSLIGASEPIVYPKVTQQLDWEAELAFVIGKTGKDIPVEQAFDYIVGYTIFNDMTARDIQLSDRQWLRGKSPDAITPVGPYLVTKDEVPNPGNLAVKAWVNGELMQDSRTDQLIFDIPYLVNFLSSAFTLEPGDIIATGTPGGVGFAREPAIFMNVGDRVKCEVEGLGSIENEVVAS